MATAEETKIKETEEIYKGIKENNDFTTLDELLKLQKDIFSKTEKPKEIIEKNYYII